MKWQGRRQSDNFERRGPGKGIAIGGIGTVVIIILGLLFGKDPSQLLNAIQDQSAGTQTEVSSGPQSEAEAFTRVVQADTEDVWNKIFRNHGEKYLEPTLVTFEGSVQSACGSASSAVGPFYCPGDSKIYIDLSFYDELQNKLNAGGDFAMAYVIAHEVGHHIQNLLGTNKILQEARGRISEAEYNKLSVKLELQADFYAGVWAHYQQQNNLLDDGDIEEALNAAHAIGDDKLQKQAQGYVVPDAFTHGTSAQRMKWFKKGYQTGDIKQGDTFNTTDL
ncbi:neutral zinc metallopeptidase [Pseudopedobacter sp.]|uniref:KPN_02809 family neutral zinc metallopeptidase n=1 Tax=Pseudopedobacter sp. TaxID=1936787 RepID=UPI00333FAD92